VTYFTPDAYEQIYLRAGLDADADLAGFVEHESVGFRARTAYHGSELGEYRYTVRAFQNGFLVRVTEDGRGLFFTVDDISLRSAEEAAEAVSRVLGA
jgi:predicted Zn-dependent protease